MLDACIHEGPRTRFGRHGGAPAPVRPGGLIAKLPARGPFEGIDVEHAVLGCPKLLELDASDPRVNPNGGPVALGHPPGHSGRPARTHGGAAAPAGRRPLRPGDDVRRRRPGYAVVPERA